MKSRYRRIIAVMTAFVVFLTTYALVMPALTASAQAYCGQEEHKHSDACYEDVLICGMEETDDTSTMEGHHHDSSCYEKQLTCEKEEHMHSLACYSNENADVETADVWEGTLPEADKMTGVPAEDLVTVAKSQLGYAESTDNYEVNEDGKTTKGYSRYGAWNGEPYADWSMDFVAFSLYYAGIDIPVDTTDQAKWIKELEKANLIRDLSVEDCAVGDLVFLQAEEDGGMAIPQMGIVSAVDDKTIKVIEGDCRKDKTTDAVLEKEYKLSSGKIIAAAKMSESIADSMPEESTADSMPEESTADSMPEESTVEDNALDPSEDTADTETNDPDAEADVPAAEANNPAAEANDPATESTEKNTDLITLSYDGEGYSVTASFSEETGLDADTKLNVSEIHEEGKKSEAAEYEKYYEQAETAVNDSEDVTGEISSARFFDITFSQNGEAVEPSGNVDITITLDETAKGDAKAIHLPDKEEAEIMETTAEGNDISFTANSFSVYGVVYTVDFHYEVNGKMYNFSIPGGEEIALSELIEVLGIIGDTNESEKAAFESVEDFLEEVADVEFSDESLVQVTPNDEGNDWILTSLQPFDTEESLTITMKNGDVVTVKVTDAQHTDDLALMLESAAIYENGDLIPWPATVRENKWYDIRLTFKENSVYQFLDTAEEMYYPVPEGLDLGDEDFTHDFSMDVGDGVKLEGNTVKYDAATNRFVVKWNTGDKTAFNKLIASNSAEFRLDFKAKFDFSKDNIEFSENVTGKVIKDTSYDVDVEKTGVYNEDADRIDYTVTVTSYGDSKEVKVTDKLFGTALTYLSAGENHGVSWNAYDKDGTKTTNETIGSVNILKTDKETYPDREEGQDCGFEVSVGEMSDGEKIEFTYSAKVDYDKLTGSGTYDETFNKVVVTTPTGEKEKDHSFTGSLHYVKLQKDHERPINWNGDNATVNWFITVNEDCKVGMKGTVISDRIYAGDVEAMDYSGTGLHVEVYDEHDTFVGTYDVPWGDSAITRNALGIDTETEEIDYASWQYTIPDQQTATDVDGNTVTINNGEHYKYIVSYTTDADKSLIVFDGYIGNEAKESKTDNEMQDGFYPPGTGTVPEVKKAVEPQANSDLKAPLGSNEDYIYWVITFDRQRYDLTRCVIEDNNPTLWGNAEPVDVTKTADGDYEYLYVEGLTSGESWEVSSATDTRTTIKFYQDADKTKPGLLRANDVYTGEDGGPDNTITIHLRTKNSAIWMDGTLTKYWPRNHTNTVTWIPNAHQVEADATATPDVRKIIKEGIQVGTIIKDGVSLPVFRYEVFLVGIDENSFQEGKLVLDDTFDTTKLALISPKELTEANGFEYTQALQENMGNNRIQTYWDQKLKGYGAVNGWIGPVPVAAKSTDSGIQFSISQTDFEEKGLETVDGEQVTCLRYSLPYYLVVKDAEAAQDIAKKTMDAGKGIAEFDNTVTWNDDSNLSDRTTVEAEFKPAQKSVIYNDQRDLATYQLTLNPQGMKLNDGQMIRVEDAYENLAVDFSTIEIKTVPADRAAQINWAYHSNKGTFWIPDETVVIITYQAQPIGDAGKNVTIKNELTMLTWKETVEKTVTLNSESEGSAGDYNIRLFKYQDDFMNQPLSGAIFQLFEVGDGASGDVQKNGKWYKPVTYQKPANVDADSEEYTHTAADVITDDVFLQGKNYPTRLHHAVGDPIYFSTGANGYSDIHLSQSRDGLALERGKQYYLYEVVTPDGYDKEDIYWSFIIDDMDFFDSAHGIYQYRDGGVLTVSNESSQDKGIVISKSFTGDARDALDWNQVQFEIVGKDKDGTIVFQRDVSFADFVKYKLKLPTLPSGNGPYTYTITEKNADVVTAERTTTVKLIKTTAGGIENDGAQVVTEITPAVSETPDSSYAVSFNITDEDLETTSETAFKIAFTNKYVEKPVDLTLKKEWGPEASELANKTLTLALYKDGEEYGLYKDDDTYKPVALSTANPKPEAVRIVLNGTETSAWTAMVKDLPRYENGKPIAWTVKEVGASYTQDGSTITVSEADMDMQFNITASMQTENNPITETVKVEHAEAAIDTTSAEKANLTLTNELATLTTVKVEKKWYDEEGNDVTSNKSADDAVTYDLYRTTDELPKGGKERKTLKVLPYRSDQSHLSDMEHILTDEIEVANGDVLEFEFEAIAKNTDKEGTWWAWWFDFVSPRIHLDCSPWEKPLLFTSVTAEDGTALPWATESDGSNRYPNSSYSRTETNPKIYVRVVIDNVEHINGHQNSLPEYKNTPSLLIRNWKDANVTVRNVTQEAESLTHAKLEKFVQDHSQTTELFRENLTLGELENELVKWNSVSNYPDGYTYFAIEHTPAGYEDTYSIVDDDNGNEVITINNSPIEIETGQELGTLTVQKAVTGLPEGSYTDKEFQFRIKNGSKYLVRTETDTYLLMSIAQLIAAGKTLENDATYTIKAGEGGKQSFSGLYPAIYTIEEVGNPQVIGYTLETTYTGNGRIGVNLGQESAATITNTYTPEETKVIFGKLWADGDNKPVAWPNGQSIEVVVHRRVKDEANSEDTSFSLTYTINAQGATQKSAQTPALESGMKVEVEALTENAVSPYYAYRYQLSGLSKKVLTGDNAGKEWVYYVAEAVPEGAAYTAGYGSLNGTAVSVSGGKQNAEAKTNPALTETEYVINQFSQKNVTFTKNWFNGVDESALATWPQQVVTEYDTDGNPVTAYDEEGNVIIKQEDIPITVTLRRRLAYGTDGLTDYDPNFAVNFSNLTTAVTMREQNTSEGKLTLRMEQSGGNFTCTISGLRQKGDMGKQSGEWKYYIIESAVDGYSTAYVLSGNQSSEGSFTDEGGTIQNTKKLGTIVLEKKTKGLPESEEHKEFSFTVKNAQGKYLTVDGGLEGNEQEAIVKTKSDGKVVFKHVPAGEYMVEEIGTKENGDAQIYGYTLAVGMNNNGVVSITDDEVKTVTVTNTYTQETTGFSFTKVWYGIDWNTPTDWLTESITVTLNRSFTPESGKAIQGDPITMTIFPQGGNSGFDYTVERKTDPNIAYDVKIQGLEKWVPKDKLPNGVPSGEWTYTLVETVPSGYYAHYFMKNSNNTQYQGAQSIDDGGRIENHLETYELPSTDGSGTRLFTILGSILVCFAGTLLVRRRRRWS